MVFSEMPTSLAISDISILAPDSSRHFIILKSVSLRSVDATDSSATAMLITVAGFRRSHTFIITTMVIKMSDIGSFSSPKDKYLYLYSHRYEKY